MFSVQSEFSIVRCHITSLLDGWGADVSLGCLASPAPCEKNVTLFLGTRCSQMPRGGRSGQWEAERKQDAAEKFVSSCCLQNEDDTSLPLKCWESATPRAGCLPWLLDFPGPMDLCAHNLLNRRSWVGKGV